MGKHEASTDTQVLQRIRSHEEGWVFTPADFVDLGSRDAVATALKRHKAAGTIRLLGRGLYDVPHQHELFGTLWPPIEQVAEAVARKDGLRLQPIGVYAANLLGLSEQVPAQAVYLTDGATRTVKVGPTQIVFKRTTPRQMAAAGRLSGLLIQGLRSMGVKHVMPKHIELLRSRIPAQERAKVLEDLALAPAWMHAHLKEIAKP
ncbi:MAG: DUF6088 family protein [Rhodoferax sp.]|uniref:DUF6088 family protein n=1 Tax=Rhodoferax sp. TaxID=50421 RepID=UPI0032678861